jgi:hypothetical protein
MGPLVNRSSTIAVGVATTRPGGHTNCALLVSPFLTESAFIPESRKGGAEVPSPVGD